MKYHELKAYIAPTADGKGLADYYLKSDVDAAIADLKKKLEDAKATAYAEMVDAGMEIRRLKRALYKACANWAHFAVAFFSSYATKEKWRKMENKCKAKEDEYK